MPVIRRGHHYGVDVLVGVNLLHASRQQRLAAALLFSHVVGNSHKAILVNVANLGALHIAPLG